MVKMINQIYHTSHCGSTLLISLLKEVTKAYSEPFWTHQIIKHNIDFFKHIGQYDNSTIKLPSALCHFASKSNGKKIFLYRQLKQHLFKILPERRMSYIDHDYYPYFRKNIHSSLKNIEFDTINKMNIFLWANRIMWISECPDISWINTNEFLSNKKDTLDFVCDYFEIEKVKNIELADIHVKSIGMNHNEIELSKVQPNMDNAMRVENDCGIISDEVCYNNYTIRELVEWTRNNLPFIPQYLL